MKIDPENRRLAQRALRLYRAGLKEQAINAVAEIGLAWPEYGVGYAMIEWIDMAGTRLRVPYGSPTELQYGCDRQDHRHALPTGAREWVWAGRLIAARFAWDQATYEALLNALPHDPVVRARAAVAVLHATATAECEQTSMATEQDDPRRANAALN